MANEAILIYETGPAIPFTVGNVAGIEKGEVLSLKDLRTVSGTVIAGDIVGGIAASEKIASDGKTKLGVYREGYFRVYLSGTCIAGDPAVLDLAKNYFKTQDNLTTLSGSTIAGTFLETGADGETVLMELKPQHATGGAQG